MQVDFRDAGPSDAAALAALGRRTFSDTFAHLYRPEDLASFLEKHSESEWRKQLTSPDFVVRIAEAEGEPVAYAKLAPLELPVETDLPALELRQFYIVKPWQGKGLARPLMDWTLAEARKRGARELYLSVWSDNQRARRLYEGYGFRFVAPYAFMVGEQADEDHILRLALEEVP
jgi:ribosomal protein S18 acetylase RimI-like enzyme